MPRKMGRVRLIEVLDGIAEILGCIVKIRGLTYGRKTVTILKFKVVGGKEADVATRGAADVDPISRAKVQVAQTTAIEVGT